MTLVLRESTWEVYRMWRAPGRSGLAWRSVPGLGSPLALSFEGRNGSKARSPVDLFQKAGGLQLELFELIFACVR
jgi:hypothetical protein